MASIAGDLGCGLQALQLVETQWQAVGPDMLLSGYLPAAGGLWGLHSSANPAADQLPAPTLHLRSAGDQPASTAAASTSSDSSSDAALLAGATRRRPDQVEFSSHVCATLLLLLPLMYCIIATQPREVLKPFSPQLNATSEHAR